MNIVVINQHVQVLSGLKLNNGTLRIVDANLNRLGEALRVLEDTFRFVMKNDEGASACKELRHKLGQMMEAGLSEALKGRDVAGDSGRAREGKGEYQRDLMSLLKANFKRAEQCCRVLEEVSKLGDEKLARGFEAMRYEIYQLEQDVLARRVFPEKALYVLMTKSLCTKSPEDVLKMTLDGGADVIQLREKEMEDGEFLSWIESAMSVTDKYHVPLIVNDRIHLVQLSGAQGVHLGQGDLPTERARALLTPQQWIGRSTHVLNEAQDAESQGVDYIGVGPLFPTNTKIHRSAVGLDYVDQVNASTSVPYVAIGAVNRHSLEEVLEHHPRGVAICTGIISAEDPYAETCFFKGRLDA